MSQNHLLRCMHQHHTSRPKCSQHSDVDTRTGQGLAVDGVIHPKVQIEFQTLRRHLCQQRQGLGDGQYLFNVRGRTAQQVLYLRHIAL